MKQTTIKNAWIEEASHFENISIFEPSLIEERKIKMDQAFKAAIAGVGEEDPSWTFWFRTLHIFCPDGRGGNNLPHPVWVELDRYQDELTSWLALNYPSSHWRGTGIYSRMDWILEGH